MRIRWCLGALFIMSSTRQVRTFAVRPSLTDVQIRGDYHRAWVHRLRSTSIDEQAPEKRPQIRTVSEEKEADEETFLLESVKASYVESETLPPPTTTTTELQQRDGGENRKKAIMLLMFIIAWLSALDRVAMSVALLPMTDDFGYSDAVRGSISSFFSVGYGLMIIPAGLIVANASPKLVMATGLTLWSISTLVTPMSAESSIGALLFARAMVGGGESVLLPSMQKMLQSWLHPDEKSVALATIISGFHAGTITAYLLTPVIMDQLGNWKSLFLVYGGFGLAILLPWLAWAQDSPLVATTDSESVPMLKAGVDDTFISWDEGLEVFREAPWQDFVSSRAVWAMIFTHAAKNWGLYNILAWTPIFYNEVYGLSVTDSAWLSVLPSSKYRSNFTCTLSARRRYDFSHSNSFQQLLERREAFLLALPPIHTFAGWTKSPTRPWKRLAKSLKAWPCMALPHPWRH